MTTRTATLTLGRDGMGNEATEADFDAWVSYVCEHIDGATGLNVSVDTANERDIQTDLIRVYTRDDKQAEIDRQTIREALTDLWELFCSGTVIRVGDRVAAGKGEDRDTGIVTEIDGETARVAWQSGVVTPADVSDLELV